MKKILFLCLLLTISLSAQVTRYVNGNATGGVYNGLSWATGWRTFADVNWGALTPGSKLYVSGGTTSVTYTSGFTVQASGTAGNYIYIMAGKYAPDPTGHSGTPTISGVSGFAITCDGDDWIYFKGLTIKDGTGGRVFNLHSNSDHITIDSCTIFNNTGVGIWSEYTSYINIKNNVIVSHTNSESENDCIIFQFTAHHIFIHHNYLHMRNLQSNDGFHIDNIQFANNSRSAFIYNNIAIVDSCNQGHNFILGIDAGTSNFSDTVLIFNNYLFNGGFSPPRGGYSSDNIYNREAEGGTGYYVLAYTINNTLISANRGIYTTRDNGRIAYASNNIMLKLGENYAQPATYDFPHLFLQGTDDPLYERVDSMKTNLYYSVWDGGMTWGRYPPSYGGDWSDWQGFGGSGINDDPEMTHNYYYIKHYNQSTNNAPYEIDAISPAIGAGTDMRYILKKFTYLPDFDYTKDIAGNTIDWSDPDIGCYQYTSGGWTPPDTTATVTINSVTNAELGSYHIGSGVLSGADSTFHIWTTTADSFRVTGGTFNTTMVSAVSGNTLYIPVVASDQYSTSVTNYVVVSGTTRSFTVTTKADPYVPPSGNSGATYGSDGKLLYTKDGKVLRVRK